MASEDEGGQSSVQQAPVEQPMDRDYRHLVFDNRRWQLFAPHAGDILVCTAPKCGTTWMQTIVVGIAVPDGSPGRVTDIATMDRRPTEPIDGGDGTSRCSDPSPNTEDAHACGRDPLVSSGFLHRGRPRRTRRLHVVTGIIGATCAGSVSPSTSGPRPMDGIEAHLASVGDVHEFFAFGSTSSRCGSTCGVVLEHRGERNVLFAHYNDMQADLDGEMRRVAEFLGVFHG